MLCYNEVTLQAAEGETTSVVPPPPPTPHGAYRLQDQYNRQEVAIGETVENYYVCNHLCSDWN